MVPLVAKLESFAQGSTNSDKPCCGKTIKLLDNFVDGVSNSKKCTVALPSVNRSIRKVDKNGTTRRRVPSAERELYLKPLLKLKQQEKVIERELTTAIENMKIEPALLQDIVHTYRDLTVKREDFLKVLHKRMADIANDLEYAKDIVKNPKEIKNLDVNTYRLKLFKLSQKIQDLTGSCSVHETLAQEQAVLDNELREFAPQLQRCEKLRRYALSSSHGSLETRPEKMNYKVVQNFHALVAKTGHTENWSQEDHLLFVKTRQKCENVPALVAAIQKKCPDLSTETIVNHEAWYKQYQTLREKQKIEVEEWRKKKLENKKSIEETDTSVEDRFVEDDIPKEDSKNDREMVQKTIKISKKVVTRSSSSAESNNSEKKELIRKWRTEKENKSKMDEEQMKLRVKLKREMEEDERRRKKERIQAALEEYRKKKALENASRESSANSKEKYDSSLIKAFREQDKEFAKRRKDRILRSQRQNKMKLPTTKMSDYLKIRDFSTLLNSTAVWREKCKMSERGCNELQYIKDVPKMCVRWRNEESHFLG